MYNKANKLLDDKIKRYGKARIKNEIREHLSSYNPLPTPNKPILKKIITSQFYFLPKDAFR